MKALDTAIEKAGGVGNLASRIGVGQTAVSNWRKRGQPLRPEHCAAIERATGREVKRWDLRPHDWHEIWPELVNAPGAPVAAANDTQGQEGQEQGALRGAA